MYMMYYMNESNERVYTMAKVDPRGNPTFSAHPARLSTISIKTSYLVRTHLMFRFSPEDKYSRQRITIKKRFGLLLTQQSPPKF